MTSIRAEVITRRTYNRPLANNRYEVWTETVDRVIDHQKWLWVRALGRDLNHQELSELEELRALMYARKVSSSGRTLWLGGTELAKHREASQFNCFASDEKFLTSEGYLSFNDFAEEDSIMVWTHRNRWRPATVKSYGNQRLYRISMSNGMSSVEYKATRNHRWILADGSETTMLKKGDVVMAAKTVPFDKSKYRHFTVTNIEELDVQKVWCLEVEEDKSFTLKGGVVTGNCAFTKAETVYDIVDILWLLLQGCGVGFQPVVGTLSGFLRPIKEIEIIPTTRTSKGGIEDNEETWDPDSGVWTISVGDSAEAWAKSIGKILAGKYPAKKLILDFQQIRPAGERLAGYGWISSGDAAISKAYVAICQILNKRAESLLTRMDILDIVNWLGTILSSRRSAEICLFEYMEPEWEEFTVAKKGYSKCRDCDGWNFDQILGKCTDCGCTEQKAIQRGQSNNSLIFRQKPSRKELVNIFDMMEKSGGSEPGFINAIAALKRAPWFAGVNPCVEVLLANKSFCNLFETDVAKFKEDYAGLQRAIYIAARANYRQTCVDLRDGILQESWHLNNEFLRLCGVGLTGIVRRPDMGSYEYTTLERIATSAAYGMADELGMQRPKNVTVIKPLTKLAA